MSRNAQPFSGKFTLAKAALGGPSTTISAVARIERSEIREMARRASPGFRFAQSGLRISLRTSIHSPCRLLIDHAPREVADDGGAVALCGRAVAAGAGHHGGEPLAGLQRRIVVIKRDAGAGFDAS